MGSVRQPDRTADTGLHVASLLDIAGTKAAVVQKRAEAKDYLDIAALLRNGVDLPTILAAGSTVYGRAFNPVITLKALSYFDDVPDLPAELRDLLTDAVARTDPTEAANAVDRIANAQVSRTGNREATARQLRNSCRSRGAWSGSSLPKRRLADPIHFLAHVMTYGTADDLAAVSGVIGRDDLCEVLDHAPPGVFDPRSWAYWNLICGRRADTAVADAQFRLIKLRHRPGTNSAGHCTSSQTRTPPSRRRRCARPRCRRAAVSRRTRTPRSRPPIRGSSRPPRTAAP